PPHQSIDPFPCLDRTEGVVLDRGLDMEGYLGRCIKTSLRDLVQNGVISFMTNASENGDRGLADQLCQIQVIEPSEVGDRPAAPDDKQGIKSILLVGREGLEDGGLDR